MKKPEWMLSPKVRNKTKMSVLGTSIQYCTGSSSQSCLKEMEFKRHPNWIVLAIPGLLTDIPKTILTSDQLVTNSGVPTTILGFDNFTRTTHRTQGSTIFRITATDQNQLKGQTHQVKSGRIPNGKFPLYPGIYHPPHIKVWPCSKCIIHQGSSSIRFLLRHYKDKIDWMIASVVKFNLLLPSPPQSLGWYHVAWSPNTVIMWLVSLKWPVAIASHLLSINYLEDHHKSLH